jgi:YD repeat-containing protein
MSTGFNDSVRLDSGRLRTALNALDQVTQITDPRTLATTYAQNALGNVATQTSPDTGITHRTFDAAGNVLTETDAAGRTVTRTYDALNRMLTPRSTYRPASQPSRSPSRTTRVRTAWGGSPASPTPPAARCSNTTPAAG